AAELGVAERVQAVYGNLSTDLDALFPNGSIARFYLNFPDPWFKRRHHKRRLLTPELVPVLWRKLGERGELFFQSDVWDLALDAMVVLETAGADRFASAAGEWSFLRANPYDAQSRRERQSIARGRPVWRLLYRKVGALAIAAPARTPPAP